jgi:CheY-like chemotaxis protein
MARAFDRYFTTKAATGGIGHGLATVRAIVQQCRGAIEVRSRPGSGTTFEVLLPLSRGTPAPDSPPDEAPRRARPGETVLVTDDEPVVREIVGSLLRALGYETIEAASAAEAIAVGSSERRIDVLVTDLAMSDLSGVELARRFAARSSETCVLIISGDTTQPDLAQINSGARVDFLQKPFDGDALGRKVRALLDGGRSLSQ